MSNWFKHENAEVETEDIGEGTKIWANAHVCKGAKIGKGCVIGEGAYIGPGVVIGDRCKIQNLCLLYEGVHVGNDVFIGPNVVTTNDVRPRAYGEWGNRFRETHIKNNVSIGAGCVILCGTVLGEGSEIGCGSLVVKDTEAWHLYFGSPAIKKNRSPDCIRIVTFIWQPNDKSKSFSCIYDESWVEKLYRGVARNLTQPFEFICLTDKEYNFSEPIVQERLIDQNPSYSSIIEGCRFDVPSIIFGLDTVITGNMDHIADYCMADNPCNKMALPLSCYGVNRACNGVTLLSRGRKDIYERHNGENDMIWLRQFPYALIDDLFPNQVNSYKGTVKEHGLREECIVFFHGEEKPHQFPEGHELLEHWV